MVATRDRIGRLAGTQAAAWFATDAIALISVGVAVVAGCLAAGQRRRGVVALLQTEGLSRHAQEPGLT
jgi:hypothetical protein